MNAESTEVKDFDQDGQQRNHGHYVTTFESNVVPEHFVFSMNSHVDDGESIMGYVDRALALELAERLVRIANDLAKPDRNGVKATVSIYDAEDRMKLYSQGMEDGVNSERSVIIRLFGEQLTNTVESLDDLRTWLRTPR